MISPRMLALVTTLLFLGAGECVAQPEWVWQNPLPQGNTLLAVSFVDAETGTAVGSHGTILRTNDGGATWRRQTSGTTMMLNAVHFTDAMTGTVVGDQATILR